jgi:hypothetical protein
MKQRMKNLSIVCLAILLYSCRGDESNNELDALNEHLPANLIEHPSIEDTGSASIHSLGKLQFVDTVHNFGRITEGEQLTYEFEFENTGSKDVLISEAKASCGCTVPFYPEHPIKKGEKAAIKVTFNSEGKKGANDKQIIITTNAYPAVYYLYIQAEVAGK